MITGRPTRQVVRLGRLTGVPGLGSMTVLGQYGVERWNADGDEYTEPPEPPEIEQVLAELTGVLNSLDLEGALIEHKGRAVGVHTRTLTDPGAASPGWRTRSGTWPTLRVDRGAGQECLGDPGGGGGQGCCAAEHGGGFRGPSGDLRRRRSGYLPAFRAALALREEGMAALLVCSASHEEDALAEISDLVVNGPAGIAGWPTDMVDALRR